MSRITEKQFGEADEFPLETARSSASNRAKNVRDAELAYQVDCWQRVLHDDAGAQVIRAILAEARIFWPSYVRGDAYETAFREGRRNLGLWLLAKIGEIDPEGSAEILKGLREKHG